MRQQPLVLRREGVSKRRGKSTAGAGLQGRASGDRLFSSKCARAEPLVGTLCRIAAAISLDQFASRVIVIGVGIEESCECDKSVFHDFVSFRWWVGPSKPSHEGAPYWEPEPCIRCDPTQRPNVRQVSTPGRICVSGRIINRPFRIANKAALARSRR